LLCQRIIEYRLRVSPVKQGLLTSQLSSESMVLFPPGEPNIIIKCSSSDAQILLVTLARIQRASNSSQFTKSLNRLLKPCWRGPNPNRTLFEYPLEIFPYFHVMIIE